MSVLIKLNLLLQPSYMPTTEAPVFTLSLAVSTGAPTIARTTQVNILLTLRNTPNRNLTAIEESAFKDELIFFFRAWDEVQIDSIKVWDQRRVEWQSQDKKRRLVIEVTEAKDLVSTAITLILQVSHDGNYAPEEIRNALVDMLQESELNAINSLWGNKEYPYFYWVDAIQSVVVDDINEPFVATLVDVKESKKEIEELSNVDAQQSPSVGGTSFNTHL